MPDVELASTSTSSGRSPRSSNSRSTVAGVSALRRRGASSRITRARTRGGSAASQGWTVSSAVTRSTSRCDMVYQHARGGDMKPAPFEYHRAYTVDEAVALLAELGDDAKVIAGGQSLVPMMNFRLARPCALVDINPVAGLDHVVREGDTLR